MSALAAVAARARGTDVLQVLALFLATLFFVLAVRWPPGAGSNEAWFALAPTRVALLTLVAAGFGAAEAGRPPARRRATLGALMLFVVASAPFDAATYAASYPAAPLWWSAGVPFLEVPAYFAVGVALGRLAAWLRADGFLAVLVPAVLVGLGWLDARLGLDVFDPLTAAVHVSWRHAAVMAALAAAGAAGHAGRNAAPPPAATDGEVGA